ncbi:hypothetical protein D3C86_2161930 [compost metagenome]
MRFLSDGSHDLSFNGTGWVDFKKSGSAELVGMAIASDGKIVIGCATHTKPNDFISASVLRYLTS